MNEESAIFPLPPGAELREQAEALAKAAWVMMNTRLRPHAWLIEEKHGPGKATEWKLAPAGLAKLKAATEGL